MYTTGQPSQKPRPRALTLFLSTLVLAVMTATSGASAAELIVTGQSDYGEYRGIQYVQYTGRFTGTTSRGYYYVPFEIVAPARVRKSNGLVVFEPPHFLLGTVGRDAILGSELLFERGFSYATVGFANQGGNMLDPSAEDFVVASLHVEEGQFPFPRDVEILKQFVESLKSDSAARSALGPVRGVYAYGISQSAEALYEVAYGPGAAGLFDLTVLHVPLWRPTFARPDTLAVLPQDFEPLPDIGKVMIVSAEGDLFVSQSIQLRKGTSSPNYRVYEVAGAPHLAEDFPLGETWRTNPLDLSPAVRAAFVAGDRWARWGRRPPANSLLAASADVNPVYMSPTGIARDANGNAMGGIRFPDVEIGRALFIASLPDEIVPTLPGIIGAWADLSCQPAPGSTTSEPRFATHQQYVHGVWKQAFSLFWKGYLLPRDALAMLRDAKASDVGKPGTCGIGTP